MSPLDALKSIPKGPCRWATTGCVFAGGVLERQAHGSGVVLPTMGNYMAPENFADVMRWLIKHAAKFHADSLVATGLRDDIGHITEVRLVMYEM